MFWPFLLGRLLARLLTRCRCFFPFDRAQHSFCVLLRWPSLARSIVSHSAGQVISASAHNLSSHGLCKLSVMNCLFLVLKIPRHANEFSYHLVRPPSAIRFFRTFSCISWGGGDHLTLRHGSTAPAFPLSVFFGASRKGIGIEN